MAQVTARTLADVGDVARFADRCSCALSSCPDVIFHDDHDVEGAEQMATADMWSGRPGSALALLCRVLQASGGHPTLPARLHRLQRPVAGAAAALSGDEPERVGRDDLGRWLPDHPEEHPQVVASGEHRVRPTPTPEELQILFDQRHPQPHRLTGRSSGTNQTRVGQGHLEASSSVDGQPQRLVEMSAKITGIASR
jgi:hypothetical protein